MAAHVPNPTCTLRCPWPLSFPVPGHTKWITTAQVICYSSYKAALVQYLLFDVGRYRRLAAGLMQLLRNSLVTVYYSKIQGQRRRYL